MCLLWRTSGRKADILTRDLLLNNLTPQVLWWRSAVCYSGAAVHVQPHLWGGGNRCQMLLPPSGPIITPSLSLPIRSLRTRADWNEAEPSPSDIAWILCILWWGQLSPNKICSVLQRERERGRAVVRNWLPGVTYFFKLNWVKWQKLLNVLWKYLDLLLR